MIYKKNVVLSSVSNGREKGVLTLEYDGGDLVGTVKLYNFSKEPDGILSVGILNDGQVIKAGLSQQENGVYGFKISGTKELNNFSCALVNFVKGEVTPLLHGSTNGNITSEDRLVNSLGVLNEEPKLEKIKETLDENGVFLEEQEEIDNLIDDEFSACDNHCSDCKYRDAFFKMEDSIKEPEEKEETFFDGVKEQITALFEKYPEEEILKQIIPESKWVKIDYEEKGEYYVVGLLYENDEIKYVCYGVPSVYSDEPPKDLKGFAQWLPIDSTKEKAFGYWITYQDAQSGENVKLEFENA